MTDEAKPASDRKVRAIKDENVLNFHGPSQFDVDCLIARIEADRAALSSAEANHKAMLAAVGEEATRQVADLNAKIETLETELALAVVPDDHEAEERAVLNAEIYEERMLRRELQEALRKVEWACHARYGRTCPSCHGNQYGEVGYVEAGHAESCELVAALARAAEHDAETGNG